MSETKIKIQPLVDAQDMAAFVRLQHEEWGDDPTQLICQPMLLAMARNGGSVLGAFDGNKLVGGAVAFLGAAIDDENRPAMANLKLVGQRLVVDENYRNQGVGYRLKLAQYAFCQQRSIRLMTWLFDPLMSVSAHIAIRKLGGVVSEKVATVWDGDAATTANHYLQADWWLTSDRVKQRLTKGRTPLALEQYLEAGTQIMNPSKLNTANFPEPSPDYKQPTSALGLIEIPARFSHLAKSDPDLAQTWREHIQALFGLILREGFILTDFVHTSHQGRRRSFYVCSLESRLRQFDQSFNQN